MKRSLRLLRWLAPYKFRIFLALLLGTLTIASHVGLMVTSAYLISRAALHPPILDLMIAIVGVRFFGISRAVFRYLERYVSHDVTFRILKNIRVSFYQALEPLAPSGLMVFAGGDLFSRIGADVETLQYFFLRVFSPPVVALLILVGFGCFLAWFNPLYSLVFALFYLAGGIGIPFLIRGLSRHVQREIPAARAALYSVLLDSVQGMADLLACGEEERQNERISRLSRKLRQLQRKQALLEGIASALTSLTMNLALWTILILAILDVRHGRLDPVFLAMMPLGVLSSFEALLPLPQVFPNLEQSLGAAERLWEITEITENTQNPVNTVDPVDSGTGAQHLQARETSPQSLVSQHSISIPTSDLRLPTSICAPPQKMKAKTILMIRNLCFRYSVDEPWVLENLDLDLQDGEKVALMGPSGAGKSTLVNILLRFWHYETGMIEIGGENLKNWDPDEGRRQVSVVAQRTYLFNATIRENLLLAKTDASEEELVEAARQAKLHEFIVSLPEGYDTYTGEGGFRLSGGQQQRLAIARAILKDAPLLILDEATSGLDSETENELMNELLTLVPGRTALFITHHPKLLTQMDRILVMNGGRIIESPPSFLPLR